MLNELKVSNKIYDILTNAINYSCEFRDNNLCVVRFGTLLDANLTYSVTIKHLNAIAEEFNDPNMIFLTGSYEIMLLVKINNEEYYD